MKQVLINLLSNAIKYNKAGRNGRRGLYRRAPRDAFASASRTPATGLTPEQLAQLFQPFNRLGQEANVEEGTGIGLVVCKRLVELMGGVIGVESTVGKGSVFWIELNLTAEPRRCRRLQPNPRLSPARKFSRRARCARCSTSRTTRPI